MQPGRHRRRSSGLILGCLILSGCRSAPVILQCPPIPDAITRPCDLSARELVTNLDLARAYLDARGCVTELEIRLQAVRALADCRQAAWPR